jgi:hypothetical protein
MATARRQAGLRRVRAVEPFLRDHQIVNVGDVLLVDHAEARRLIVAGLVRDDSPRDPPYCWPGVKMHTR